VFQHKLCVTCSGTSPVRIRVQSNGLPRYCPYSPHLTNVTTMDFTVNFNPDVSINSPVHNPTTAAALNGIVCNVSQTDVPSGSNYTLDSSSVRVSGLAGISVDGVSIANVNDAYYRDPFYPPNANSSEGVNACLGHPDIQAAYHYHMASGCALTRPTGNISTCANTPACSANVSNYGITLFNAYRTLTVIGIAKDGHVIYGPYYSSGAEVIF
jgi:YHYH protein